MALKISGRKDLDIYFIIGKYGLHIGPGVDSASTRNENQEYSLGVKAAGA
jgi:hypothetical protein